MLEKLSIFQRGKFYFYLRQLFLNAFIWFIFGFASSFWMMTHLLDKSLEQSHIPVIIDDCSALVKRFKPSKPVQFEVKK